MKFKEFMDLGIKTEEGVLITKYLMDIYMAELDHAKNVKDKFLDHGYTIDVVPGEFLKIFTMNEKEIDELDKILVEIDALGLKDVFQDNLRLASFKRAFLERVKFCITNKFPYLHEDNTFIEQLYRADSFALYTVNKPISMIKNTSQIDTTDEKETLLDAEDKQVYNEIVESLNYLILQNSTNEYLPAVVNNITKKVVDALVRKEYHFLPLREVIAGVMFDGLDVTPEMENVRDLVLSAFPEERGINEGRGLA